MTTLKNSEKQAGGGRAARIAVLVVFLGGLLAFFALGGDDYLTLETIKSNRDFLLAFTAEHFAAMAAAAVLIYIAATALSIPGALLLSLTVGLLFGRWMGTVIIMVSATVGATLVFLAARYLFADAARRRMGPLALKIVNGFHDNAFHYLMFLRLVPVFPFWLVNLVPAFTAIGVRTYVLATAIGMLPGSFVFANLGQSLGRIESVDQLLSREILLAFALLGLFALLPIVIKRLRAVGGIGQAR